MKFAHTLLPIGMLAAASAQADILALDVSVDYWDTQTQSVSLADRANAQQGLNFSDEATPVITVNFEHPLPLIPNAKARYTRFDTDGNSTLGGELSFVGIDFPAGTAVQNDLELNTLDMVLYYTLPIPMMDIDFGLNFAYIDGDVSVKESATQIRAQQSFDVVLPAAYLAAEIPLPLTGLSIYGDVSYTEWDDSSYLDYQLGAAYELIDILMIDLELHAGYRKTDMELDDLSNVYADVEYDGFFAGAALKF